MGTNIGVGVRVEVGASVGAGAGAGAGAWTWTDVVLGQGLDQGLERAVMLGGFLQPLSQVDLTEAKYKVIFTPVNCPEDENKIERCVVFMFA